MVSNSSFETRIVEQRRAMRVSNADLAGRIPQSPMGAKSKAVLQQHVDLESTGSVGYALWNNPPVIERGSGARVYDADGKEYIDMLAGFSVNNLGHGHEKIVSAIRDQAGEMIQYFDLPHPQREALAQRLVDVATMDDARVMFGVTGSEAVDGAVKLARWYTGAPLVLSTYGAYHGTTQGAMAMTAKGGMWSYFYPVGPHDTGHAKIPFSYPYRSMFGVKPEEDAEACLDFTRRLFRSKESPFGDGRSLSNVAAIIVEPMQASAGYIIPGDGYLAGLREICDEYGMLLIVDEIQTGMGRSGKMWAHEHENIVPDMLITSKGMASGMPISAVVTKDEILQSWGPGAHVSTFAATHLACAAANATLDVFKEEDIVARCASTGDYFREQLLQLQDKHPIIGHVDARGLFIGIEFVRDRTTKEPADDEATRIMNLCFEDGLLFEKGGYYYNRFQFIPPLTITRDDIDEAITIFDRALTQTEKEFNITPN